MENLKDIWTQLGLGLSDEMGNSYSNDSARAHGRQDRTDGLDRDRCVKDHERFRRQWMMQAAMFSASFSISDAENVRTVSAPLSRLKVITLPELVLDKRHYGRVLFGRFCVTPFKVSSVNTVLEDSAGRGVRVAVYNVVSSTASSQEIEARFPLGMRVAIKEPFFKLAADGKTAIRVDNPADIELDKSTNRENDNSQADNVAVDVEKIRCEGNRLFGEQNWAAAVNKYTECIDVAVGKMDKNCTTNINTKSEDLDRVVMLAYSNRAEARLRLEAYEDALTDAEKALEFDANHLKTLVRKGKAAHGLGLFKKSCESFQAALKQSPQQESIMENLKDSTTAYEQSRSGYFDLTNYYSTGKAPSCADYVGPVQIGRVCYGYGRRGLFTTTNIEAGTVLLVSNPMAIARQKSDCRQMTVNINFKIGVASNGTVNSGVQQDLITELVNRAMTSKRKIAQLYSLAVNGTEEMPIPPMELFSPGSEWVPPVADNLAVNVDLIREIARMNSFGDNDSFIHLEKRLEEGDRATKDVTSGLWVLPSFANHSCTPNCLQFFIGGALFFRASREIARGEEITISYFDSLFENREARRAKAEAWLFACNCERCLLEESLKSQLVKINKQIQDLAEEAKAESGRESHKREATRQLAGLADEVEAVIHSLEPKHQGWIRATFLDAYLSKYELAMEEHDAQARISSLRLIVDSMTTVAIYPTTLQFSALLLREIEQRYFKHSQAYHLTEERVLGIYRAFYGKQTKTMLHNLIKARLVKFDYSKFGF